MTALENVALPLMFKGVGKEEREQRAMEMLKLVGIDNRYKHKPKEMSGGQQQRVGIARAFVTDPSVVLPEPDVPSIAQILFRSISRLTLSSAITSSSPT